MNKKRLLELAGVQLDEAAKGIPVQVEVTQMHLKAIVKILKKYFDFETTVDQLLSSKYFVNYVISDAETLFHETYDDPEGLMNAFDGIDVSKLPGKRIDD